MSEVGINVKLSEYSNRVIGVYKEYYGLSNKSEAINKFIEKFGEDLIDREVKDEVIEEIKRMDNELKNKKPITFEELDRL